MALHLRRHSADNTVQKIFDLEFASQREKYKHEMAKILEKHRLFEGDTGSAEVQGEWREKKREEREMCSCVLFPCSGHADASSAAPDAAHKDAPQGQVVPARAHPGGPAAQKTPPHPQGIQAKHLPQPAGRAGPQTSHRLGLPSQLQEQATQEVRSEGPL